MTTSLGIAAATAVLRRLLANAIPLSDLGGVIGDIDVSVMPPDLVSPPENGKGRLNLFLYQMLPNPGWRNAGQPSHDATGRRVSNPPLALDLHYMLSAYGTDDVHAQILLGYSALLLHQTRGLSRETIRDTFRPPGGGPQPPLDRLLSTSGLDAQEEILKLSLLPLSIDDISRLWAVLGEKYRPSIAFSATVLLMRGSDSARTGLPVTRSRLTVTTSIHPSIDRIDPPVTTAGSVAFVIGTGLLTPDTVCRFGSGESPRPAAASTPTRLRVLLPTTLRAGTNTMWVAHAARFGDDLRRGAESNVVPFVLRPAFTRADPADPDLTVTDPVITDERISATVSARLDPAAGPGQDVSLLLTRGGAAEAYTVPAAPRQADSALVSFPVTGVVPGEYLARVRVDGAETELTTDADGTFTGPVVDLT